MTMPVMAYPSYLKQTYWSTFLEIWEQARIALAAADEYVSSGRVYRTQILH